MAFSSGTRSLFGELASWAAAAAILIVGIVYYDAVRNGLNEALGITDLPAPATIETANTSVETTPVSQSGREELRAQQDGHYYARAEINGRLVDVMVDTGASMVALTYEDAQSAGLSLKPSDFTGRVSTANGTAAVAPVTLDRVSIGRVLVRNVRAAVCERGKLEKTLLGMSFLSQLERVDINQGRLTLVE
jgi:aspartyl protease family protein